MNPESFKGKNGAQEGWEAFYMPGDPFEHEIVLWGWDSTRIYMRARFGLVDALRRTKTTEALQWALGHAIRVLQLNRSDALGVRYMVPAMMVRLGNDQEAYDFVKWWAMSGRDKEYDWGDPHASYLQLRAEDMFEDVVMWTVNEAELANQVVVLLVKLKLLVTRQERLEFLKGRMSARESWNAEGDLDGKTVGRGAEVEAGITEVFDSLVRESELLSAQARDLTASAVRTTVSNLLQPT
ncbi:hypothetical protein Slin15195_G127060 [Septoria linicola]|uniref:Uncharacterized protein n=1 Tax=Septoria linicola TaxID=215465 RepID=A0A9Q9ER05_9PEZI|nr:hypothetical protein Slin15195_G127060 [Septoria linicola]